MLITGGHPLMGEITVSGGKNTAVAVIPAVLLCDEPCTIENLPDIDDVHALIEILQRLGAETEYVPGRYLTVDPRGANGYRVPFSLTKRLRASYYLLGALLGRGGRAEVAYPGGCDIGSRPIDQHLKGFSALGAQIEDRGGMVYANAERLLGGDVFFDMVTVGGTINVMLAAARAEGTTVIYNAAKEPHIVDLANFLNSMGANIMGAGTDVIKIRGVKQLRGGTYSIIPDQIEAGTYMAAVAAAGGDVLIQNVIPKHLDCITAKLVEMGVEVEELDDAVRVRRSGPISRTNVKTMPYPGFPTDMQPQIAAVLCLANGTSVLTEGVWDSRYRYVDEFRRMGAHIQVDGKVAVIEGVPALTGAPVHACDLRAGAAMVIAGLAAQGVTEVDGIYHIERGYENLVGKLAGVGADIRTITVPDEDAKSQAG